MVKLNFDALAHDDLVAAPADPDAAARVLLHAVPYLRQGRPVPEPIASFIADAIAVAMHKPPEQRVRALGLKLHLMALNKRPVKLHPLSAKELLDNGTTVAKIAKKHRISASTVRRLIRKADAMYEAQYKACQE